MTNCGHEGVQQVNWQSRCGIRMRSATHEGRSQSWLRMHLARLHWAQDLLLSIPQSSSLLCYKRGLGRCLAPAPRAPRLSDNSSYLPRT